MNKIILIQTKLLKANNNFDSLENAFRILIGQIFKGSAIIKLLHRPTYFHKPVSAIADVFLTDIDSVVSPQMVVEYNTNIEESIPYKLYQRPCNRLNEKEQAYLEEYCLVNSKEFQVIPIDGFEKVEADESISKVLRRKGEMMFAYIMEGGKSAKVFCSGKKSFTWLGNGILIFQD